MKKLESEIMRIKEEIINSASMVTEMMYEAVNVLKTKDVGMCKKIIETDEIVDSKEIEIENAIIKVIALYQPEADLLRTAIMSVKMNKDIERIGDHAVNIANNTVKILEIRGDFEVPEEVDKIFNILSVMMNKTIRAFVDNNSQNAKKVIEMDKEIDELRNIGISKAISIAQKADDVRLAIFLLLVFKDLERIGDLLTNISEDIFYIIEGKIIEHKYK